MSTGDIHYTQLAIQQGYTVDVYNNEYKDAIAKKGPAPGMMPKITPAIIPIKHQNKSIM